MTQFTNLPVLPLSPVRIQSDASDKTKIPFLSLWLLTLQKENEKWSLREMPSANNPDADGQVCLLRGETASGGFIAMVFNKVILG